MANHCKVITKQTLDCEKITARVNELIKTKLAGLFELHIVPTGEWVLVHKKDAALGFMFWLTSQDENYKDTLKDSVIEFRHGHQFPFMWFIEGVIRENLAKDYDAYMVDEGTGTPTQPKPENFETFEAFCNRFGEKSYEAQRRHYTMDFGEEIPADIKKVLLK